jgi:hypothetical protein
VDVLLFIPVSYGTYLLQQQGSIALLNVENATGVNDPFQNPLLFLVPALGIFTLSLFSVCLINPVMALVSHFAGRTKISSLTMATRQLSRSPNSYYTPLIILILTVSLSSYAESLTYKLDEHPADQAYYQVGADIQFIDFGSLSLLSSMYAPSGGAEDEATWFFIPVDEYREIKGVDNLTRLGR